jgi:hypothetical protein
MSASMTNFTREDFIAWLSKQPPEREWDFQDPQECVIADYLRKLHRRSLPLVTPYSFRINDGEFLPMPDWLVCISRMMGKLESEIISARWLQEQLGLTANNQEQQATQV